MDFYYSPVSGNSARTAFALYEAGIAHTPHRLDASRGDNRDAAYVAINPMGKIPSLVDDGVTLWESNAINWYLADKHPAAALLPASPEGRASVLRWLFFQSSHVSPACRLVFRSTSAQMRAYWKVEPNPREIEAGHRELARYLPVLEQALADREWLEGRFSLADLAYAPHLWLVGDGGYDFSSTPRVWAWLERLMARPAWHKAKDLIFGAQGLHRPESRLGSLLARLRGPESRLHAAESASHAPISGLERTPPALPGFGVEVGVGGPRAPPLSLDPDLDLDLDPDPDLDPDLDPDQSSARATPSSWRATP